MKKPRNYEPGSDEEQEQEPILDKVDEDSNDEPFNVVLSDQSSYRRHIMTEQVGFDGSLGLNESVLAQMPGIIYGDEDIVKEEPKQRVHTSKAKKKRNRGDFAPKQRKNLLTKGIKKPNEVNVGLVVDI